jgi:muconolactone delta-isomerase
MKILALEVDVPGVDEKAFTDDLLKEEAGHAWKLHQSGVIRELYFRADRHTAVLVLECASLDEAKAVLSTLPLVRRALIDFEIIPLSAYAGFARLFERE